jgi:hypothetical protein
MDMIFKGQVGHDRKRKRRTRTKLKQLKKHDKKDNK